MLSCNSSSSVAWFSLYKFPDVDSYFKAGRAGSSLGSVEFAGFIWKVVSISDLFKVLVGMDTTSFSTVLNFGNYIYMFLGYFQGRINVGNFRNLKE